MIKLSDAYQDNVIFTQADLPGVTTVGDLAELVRSRTLRGVSRAGGARPL